MVKKRLAIIFTILLLVCFVLPNFIFAQAVTPTEIPEEAIWNKNVAEVKKAIENGADVNARPRFGDFILNRAIKVGSLEMVKLLIEKGADVNAKEDGRTPLCTCAYMYSNAENKEDFLKMAKLLIAKGADVNARSWEGITPLMETASNNFLKMAKLLIAKGADVNAKSKDGATALTLAEKYGHNEIVVLLKKHGAK